MPDEIFGPMGNMEEELERQLFHLKTLYDVSRELLGPVEVEPILKNFLMMTTGNFGVLDGFVLTQEMPSKEISHMVSVGFKEDRLAGLEQTAQKILSHAMETGLGNGPVIAESISLSDALDCALVLPVDDSCIGLLGLGPKILRIPYSESDRSLLITLANHLTVVLKNARYAEALKDAYAEVSSLNRAKDKVINHLSHELKTPLALLKASLTILQRNLSKFPAEEWKCALDRAERNLQRLMEVSYEVQDIMRGDELKARGMLQRLLDQCTEQLEVLLTDEFGETSVLENIRTRIEEIYGPRDGTPEEIDLERFVAETLQQLKPSFAHRNIHVSLEAKKTPAVLIPAEVLHKVVEGLLRNAIENTPDKGKVEIEIHSKGSSVQLKLRDSGVGIFAEHQERIFEGFYPTQDTDAYSSRKPFDFNAGGKGADLLRMKIFSERYHFDLSMKSTRCKVLPGTADVCPGAIDRCPHCEALQDCYESGGTCFAVCFPVGEYDEPSQSSWPKTCRRALGQ